MVEGGIPYPVPQADTAKEDSKNPRLGKRILQENLGPDECGHWVWGFFNHLVQSSRYSFDPATSRHNTA